MIIEIKDLPKDVKKDIFEMKSNINSETETNIIQTIHKLDRIIWGYDDDRTKFNKIKEVLQDTSPCLE